MQQVLSFSIDIFDVRRKNVIKIRDDSSLVGQIQVRKDLQLNNQAVISFVKSKSYELLEVEKTIKLFNYVKIELIVKNKDAIEGFEQQTFYFSGFITNVGKQTSYGQTPMSSVSITISDFASLFKSTFYTKNLTFLDILQDVEPSFRLLNFSDVFNDKDNKLLNDFYSLNQMGYIFFVFFFFRFLYGIVYESQGPGLGGTPKKVGDEKIFKDFKIFMPFGFDVAVSNDGEGNDVLKEESFFKGQVSSLIIYKHLQGVALDLYKYLYPEPIFEFSTYETKDSVILQIRPTPFMSFDRNKDNVKDVLEEVVDSYRVIENQEFGHQYIAGMTAESKYQNLPNYFINEHLKKITTIVNNSTKQTKNLDVKSLIPNDTETKEIIDKFYKMIPINVKYLESSSMNRSAQSVVNVIWTTPAMDTAVLQTSGRALVYALLEQRLSLGPNGKRDPQGFKDYVNNQFVSVKDPNPVFLMKYPPERWTEEGSIEGLYQGENDFMSGDMKFFGFREFEVKWNCLTMFESSANYILKQIDRELLKKIADSSENTNSSLCKTISKALDDSAQKIDKKTTTEVKRNTEKIEKVGVFYKKALNNKDFLAAMAQMGYDPKKFTEKNACEMIKKMQEEGTDRLGKFVSKLNGIIAKSYRENEHLYDCNILKPIDVSILPGMIVDSVYPNYSSYNLPRFRGYVTAVAHAIDFNSSSMHTTISLSRTASNDSRVLKEE